MKDFILYSIIGGIVSFILGIPFVKKVMGNFYMPLKEVSELVQVVIKALEDGKITKSEIQEIIAETKDLKNGFKKLKEKS